MHSIAASAGGQPWRHEPFRLFFPLAVLIGWVGVGHWLLYVLGVTSTFSGFFHGQVMMQAFMMAFALGFLLTAVPRRTQSPPPSTLEITVAAALLVTIVVAALVQRWVLAQLAYAAIFVVMLHSRCVASSPLPRAGVRRRRSSWSRWRSCTGSLGRC